MSISKVQDLLQNKGCVWTVSILMVVGVVVSSFAQCGRADHLNSTEMMGSTEPVATVGGSTITDRVMADEVSKVSEQYAQMQGLPPQYEIGAISDTVKSVVGYAFIMEVAKKYGVSISDDEIMKQVQVEIDQQVQGIKDNMIQQKRLKDKPTEAEFDAAFQQMSGMTVQAYKDKAIEMQRARLKAPDTRLVLEALTITQPLIDAIKKTVKATADEAKASEDKFVFKSIEIKKGDVEATAKKAEADIKGGLSFETAIDRYSNATAADPKKKKLHDETIEVPRKTLTSTVPQLAQLNPLATLKKGEVSEPIKAGAGYTIYKLIEIKPNPDKEFDKNKDARLEAYTTYLASMKLQTEIADAGKATKIEWKDKVYQALYDYSNGGADPEATKDRQAWLMSLLTKVLEAQKDAGADSVRLANKFGYALYGILQEGGTPAQKAKLEELKPDILRNYLQDTENANLRIELVKSYYAKKDAGGFYEELSNAANANLSQPNAAGQGIYNDINKYLKLGEDAKLLTAEQVKEIEDIQRQWVDAKTEQDKYDAEAKKQAEEDKKNNPSTPAQSREDFNKQKTGKGSTSQPKGK